ncbi:EF-Tu/IF-2/RF-3 family GTPase, partial [Acinetobacter baumannii]|uniref:EF-Tu/IF-2/RF-3 family GTPase n=1 Tax=Acinetobacter baumannii TaxID=470 RepID=UPI000ADB3E95
GGDFEAPLQLQVTMLDYNEYMGRIGIGRIHRGTLRRGDTVAQIKRDGSIKQVRINKLFGFSGLKRIEIEEA